jgi:hypothetical protein
MYEVGGRQRQGHPMKVREAAAMNSSRSTAFEWRTEPSSMSSPMGARSTQPFVPFLSSAARTR